MSLDDNDGDKFANISIDNTDVVDEDGNAVVGHATPPIVEEPGVEASSGTLANPVRDNSLACLCACLGVDIAGIDVWFLAHFTASPLCNVSTSAVLEKFINSLQTITEPELSTLKDLVKKAHERGERVLASPRMSNTYATQLSKTVVASDALVAQLAAHDARMALLAHSITRAQLEEAIVFFAGIGLDTGVGSFVLAACPDDWETTKDGDLCKFLGMPDAGFDKDDPTRIIIGAVTHWAEPPKKLIEGTEIVKERADGTQEEILVLDGEAIDISEFAT
jgi:hypothetical protein